MKVTVVPLTTAICFISVVGRSWRLNQLAAPPPVGVVGVSGSSVGCPGLWSWQTTRQSGDAQTWPRPCGSAIHCAPESSSRSTICPTERPAVLATVTDVAPLAASAVRFVEDPCSPSARARR